MSHAVPCGRCVLQVGRKTKESGKDAKVDALGKYPIEKWRLRYSALTVSTEVRRCRVQAKGENVHPLWRKWIMDSRLRYQVLESWRRGYAPARQHYRAVRHVQHEKREMIRVPEESSLGEKEQFRQYGVLESIITLRDDFVLYVPTICKLPHGH
jgi:hypothetical protein